MGCRASSSEASFCFKTGNLDGCLQQDARTEKGDWLDQTDQNDHCSYIIAIIVVIVSVVVIIILSGKADATEVERQPGAQIADVSHG